MKPDSCIYILSSFPVLNEDELKIFPLMDKKHSASLYSALILNHKEVLRSINPQPYFYFCFDERDKEYIPEELNSEKLVFYPAAGGSLTPDLLIEKYLPSHSPTLVMCSGTIGINSNEIKKIFDIMNIEDEAAVIGKSGKERTAFIALNYDNSLLLEGIVWDKPNFDAVLSRACMFSNRITVLDDYMLINSVDDFKNLYSQLSKKESLTYCSQAVHEKFTNIFIEYKDLLK